MKTDKGKNGSMLQIRGNDYKHTGVVSQFR
jgi:hypothetical protein